ncbi:MAG: YcgN family cysteine cluster protein [Pseudomonadota bacterium]
MARANKPFWETKHLEDMDRDEWESLCDGCAKCCLIKLEDEDTGEIALTRLHCRLLDAGTCQCSDYPNRKAKVPDCVILTPKDVSELRWMPQSCAYRLIHEGKPLPDWHPLVSGDRDLIHRSGNSIMGRTLSEETLFDPDDADQIAEWIVDWDGNEP